MAYTLEDYLEDIACDFCGWTDGEHSSGCPYQPQEPACPKCGRILIYTCTYNFGDPNLGIASELWRCECGKFSTTDIRDTRQ